MAGNLKTNTVSLGDSSTDTQNFQLRTNVNGTATLARGAAGNLGDVLTVPASGAAKIVGALQLAQIVSTYPGTSATGTALIPFDNTIPQITEGTEFMTLAITPKDAASTLEITVVLQCGSSAAATLTSALFQDATANALRATSSLIALVNGVVTVVFTHLMVAGTTSTTTFRVRGGANSAGTVTFNGNAGAQIFGGVAGSSITIKEYLP